MSISKCFTALWSWRAVRLLTFNDDLTSAVAASRQLPDWYLCLHSSTGHSPIAGSASIPSCFGGHIMQMEGDYTT